jgi:hypothetical protein
VRKKMKWQCALLQRWLPEYPEGDLSAFWRRRLKVHLDHCPSCRSEQQALKEVVDAIQTTPAADPGPEFWAEFSREMHLKLVQASQEGQMAPARSVWWGRLPYLVGAPALAALILWVAVGYLNPERPGMAPGPQMAKEKSAAPAEKLAAKPRVLPAPAPSEGFVYVRNGGDEAPPEEDFGDDLDSTLAGMTAQEKEAFLKKLSRHKKDGSWLRRYSTVSWA